MGLIQIFMLATAATANPAADIIAFKYADVLVVDAANQPLFRSSRDYLLKMANNPVGQVIRTDPLSKRVLVSSAGPEYWVRCAELSPMPSCPVTSAKPATRSIKIPRSGAPADAGLASRGLPACPGDPRCPKPD